MIIQHFKWARFGLKPASKVFYIDDQRVQLFFKWQNKRQNSYTPPFLTKAYKHNTTGEKTLSSFSILDSNNTTLNYELVEQVDNYQPDVSYQHLCNPRQLWFQDSR